MPDVDQEHSLDNQAAQEVQNLVQQSQDQMREQLQADFHKAWDDLLNIDQVAEQCVNAENASLAARHEAKSQELQEHISNLAMNGQEPRLEAELSERVQDLLRQFQVAQLDQVAALQSLERETIASLKETWNKLAERSNDEWATLQQRSVNMSSNETDAAKTALNDRAAYEQASLVTYINAALDTLRQCRDRVESATTQNQNALQDTIFAANSLQLDPREIERHVTEQRSTALTAQETAREALELVKAQYAFANSFDLNPDLKKVWERASIGTNNYGTAMKNFWNEVNNNSTADGVPSIRKMLDLAGYQLGQGAESPMLRQNGWAEQSRVLKADSSRDSPNNDMLARLVALTAAHADDAGWFARREQADRKLTLDHLTPQSVDRQKSLDSSNIRFLSSRDNSSRREFFDQGERKYKNR